MSLKEQSLDKWNRDAVLSATGGQLKGKAFREAQRKNRKQNRINRKARRKAERRGDRLMEGYEGYKIYDTEEQKVAEYFGDLKKARDERIKMATAAAVAAAATAGVGGAFAAGTTAPVVTTGGSTAAMTTGGATFTGGATLASGSIPAGATSAAGGTALGTTAVATPTALTTGQKILQGVKKVKKVTDTAKDVVDIVNTTKDIASSFGGDEEQQAPPNYYNPLAGPVTRGYAQSFAEANMYGTPMAPTPQAQPYTELASPYEMGMITDPNAYMQNMSNMEIYNQNIRQNVLQADNAQAQNLAGLGATLKSGGRIKKSLGDRYKMGGRIKAN